MQCSETPMKWLLVACALLFCLAAVADEDVPLLRGKPSMEQIIEALKPAPEADQPARHTRGLAPAPFWVRALDLDIPFAFNSHRLTRDGAEVLDQLGAALKSKELSFAKRIVLEGHTDARGRPAYNQALSLRRAQAVSQYLASRHDIPAEKMKVVGKGSSQLADPARPEDVINRRVRVILEL